MKKMSEIKFRHNVLLILFIFSMMFSFEINGYKMRYFVLLYWLLYCLHRIHNISVKKEICIIPIGISVLMVYAAIVMLVNGNNNLFELLRLSRAFLTYLIIYLFIESGNYSKLEILCSIKVVILIHAIVVILGVLIPETKEFVLPVSQYQSRFLRYRSTGLVSGYDLAGYLCNIGLIIDYFLKKEKSESGLSLTMLLFVVATTFTSRFNMLCMAVMVFFVLLLELKSNSTISKVIAIFFGIIGISVVLIFWTLTTNVSPALRVEIIKDFPFLDKIYNAVMGSYTDYGIHVNVIKRHLSPMPISMLGRIFGIGLRPSNSDIGYIKSMFSIGMIGILTEIIIYGITCKYIINNQNKKNMYVIIYLIAVFFMFVMESKISFVFASTTFEMLSLMYLSILGCKDGEVLNNSGARI